MERIRQILCIAALTITAGACESPASSQDHAIEAQREADQARVEAEREAAEKVVAAQAEANAATVEARDEAQRTIEKTQAAAAEAQGEAGQDLTKARNDLREWTRGKLRSIDRSIGRSNAPAPMRAISRRTHAPTLKRS